jgi:hypothetical protein
MKVLRKLQRQGLLVTISTIALGASASGALAASPVTVTTTLTGSPPSAPGFSGTASGTYSASGAIGDSGSASAQFVLPSHPPKSTQIESRRTLTSASGTLELQCSETSLPASPAVTRGSCAVLSASAVYTGLSAHGTLTGQIVQDPTTGLTTVYDTIVF